tara:strand:- start:1174 stop:1464 length:291 start_codon:yes stop_codon:yes gene_type:complete
MRNKFILIILLLFFISACSVGLNRSDKADEFLIEKKNPLIMPPDIDNLPKPNEETETITEENNFKEKIKSKKTNTNNSNIESSGTLQESIIKKIEQ